MDSPESGICSGKRLRSCLSDRVILRGGTCAARLGRAPPPAARWSDGAVSRSAGRGHRSAGACSSQTPPTPSRGSPWCDYDAHQRQGQAEQRGRPVAVASGGKLPGRHLHLSRHRAGIAGENVVEVVSSDGVSPPLPVWKFNRHRPNVANPCRSASGVSLDAIRRVVSGERLGSSRHNWTLEISAWPGAQTESARARTGLIPGRGGSSAGT